MILLFDLDGTILDTYALIRQTFIEVFKRFLPTYKYTEDDLKSFFGPTLYNTFTKIGCNKEECERLFTEYRKINKDLQSQYLKLFPHTFETLEKLKENGYKLAIFSNKIHEAIVSGLKEMKIYDYFDFILGSDEISFPKPDPQGIKIVEKKYQEKCIYIGDTASDMVCAKNASCLAIGITQGGTSKDVLFNGGADYVIDNLHELPKLLEVINV